MRKFIRIKHIETAMTSTPGQDLMQNQYEETEDLARRLEATGNYKVLRRLVPREPTTTPPGYADKFGIIIDFETTGLDDAKDEIIEVAMMKFRYSDDNLITGVAGTFQSFNEPSRPIPAGIVELTGISDQMVAGHKIDGAAIEGFVAEADIVIAHNASFDRKFAERSWAFFEHRNWACSASEIDWRKIGFGGAKLVYLIADAGFFYGAHRAIDDCHATLELLARPLPKQSTTAFSTLMDRASRKTFRIWAEGAPYSLKDALKRKGYRWNDGTDGRPRSWHIDVGEDKRDAELIYLKKEIYQRDVNIECRPITALERFSKRA